MSNYTTTKSGQHIRYGEPFTPSIHDIAYSLSKICRFNGHIEHFFPVSAHCVLVAELSEMLFGWDSDLYKAALLHDAQEAYIGDLASPLKHLPELEGYVKVELWFAEQIKKGFNLKYSFDDPKIKKADKLALLFEGTFLLRDNAWAKEELQEFSLEIGKEINKEKADDLFEWLKGMKDDVFAEAEELFLNAYDEVK